MPTHCVSAYGIDWTQSIDGVVWKLEMPIYGLPVTVVAHGHPLSASKGLQRVGETRLDTVYLNSVWWSNLV